MSVPSHNNISILPHLPPLPFFITELKCSSFHRKQCNGKHARYSACSHTHTYADTHTCPTLDSGPWRPWGNRTKTIPWLSLFTSCRPCCACVLCAYLWWMCVRVCVYLHACSHGIAKCIHVVQRAFEGLIVHTWECAGVQRFISLCLCIYISVLFALNYTPLPTCCANLMSQKVLSGFGAMPGFGWCHPCGPGMCAKVESEWPPPQRSQVKQCSTKQRWICLLPVAPPVLSISFFLVSHSFPHIHLQYPGLFSKEWSPAFWSGWVEYFRFLRYNHCANIPP